jgi:N-glycosylase/DNA lyase
MPSLFLSHPLDLSSTLLGGQSFSWNPVSPSIFSGWIASYPVQLQIKKDHIHWDNFDLSPQQIRHYLSLDLDLPSLLQPHLTSDPHLLAAAQQHPGLRPLREDPWECLANFICSSLKQITQIRQIHANLRSAFGGPTRFFPSPSTLAKAGEQSLRDCALGYRARHLAATAHFLASQPSFLSIPSSLPTPQAAAHLETLPGVGPKISRCVLLYAYGRFDAFPVDVWVDRLLRQLYFPKKRKPFRFTDLEIWSQKHFGPNRGLAQLLLFHWFRTQPKTSPSRASKRRLRHAL